MSVERQTTLADAGIVDKNVDLALPVARFLDFRGQGVIVGRFKWQDQGIRLDVCCYLFKCIRSPTRQDDVRPCLGKRLCQCFANS